MFFHDYYSLIIMLPLFIISLIIQGKLNSTYSKYSKVGNSRYMTGAEAAQAILNKAGIYDVSVEFVSGNLSDHYDPIKKVIRLSEGVFNGTSVAAVGIAAHESGHAIQHAVGYTPLKIRSSVVSITNFSSKLLYFLMILSIFANIPMLCGIAVICFLVLFFFQLITLPVEFNASTRAIRNIDELGFSSSDMSGVKRVLSSAAMTYVAAMLISLGQLVTFILRNSRRD